MAKQSNREAARKEQTGNSERMIRLILSIGTQHLGLGSVGYVLMQGAANTKALWLPIAIWKSFESWPRSVS